MAQPLWVITGTTDTTIWNAATGSTPAKRVSFKVLNGDETYIDIPLQNFTPENVGNTVHDMAMKIVEVMGLQGPIVPADSGTSYQSQTGS